MSTRYWLMALLSLIPPITSKWSLIPEIYSDELSLMDPHNWIGLGAHSFFAWILQILCFAVVAIIYWNFSQKGSKWIWSYLSIIVLWSLSANFLWGYICGFFLTGEEKFVGEVVVPKWIFSLSIEFLLILLVMYFEIKSNEETYTEVSDFETNLIE